MQAFNFDEWAELYRTDPTEFERKRREVLEQEIAKAPVDHRNDLRVIQMECDVIHEMQDPLAATKAMSEMMVDKLQKMSDHLKRLQSVLK